MESITSEQELKTLLDEGKITQEEYQELLAAMKDKPRQNGNSLPTENKMQPKTGMGRVALVLFIIAVVLPLVGMLTGFLGGIFLLVPLGLLGLLCGLLAFIFGIIAWKTTTGKIATLGVPIIFGSEILLMLIVLPFFAYKAARADPLTDRRSLAGTQVYRTYSCDSRDLLIVGQSHSPVEKGIISEEQGTIKIQVLAADTFHLYETGPLQDAGNTMLFYQAKVRSEALTGKAYLEMWCSIPGKGEFFSRGLDQTISGTNNWMTMQIPFRNDSGINPDNIKLNLVVEGTGRIWVDDIRVTGQSL